MLEAVILSAIATALIEAGIVALCVAYRGSRKNEDIVTDVSIALFDECEVIEGCTVEILRNSVTGDESVGWWRGSAKDCPLAELEEEDDLTDGDVS